MAAFSRRPLRGKGQGALPIAIVAANVSPLIIPAREKLEPTHVGCCGIPNVAGATGRAGSAHSALFIPHLNGSFQVFILEWRKRTIYPCRKSISGDNGIMTTTVEAIYEHGKLLLPAPLSLPEKSHVRVTIESDVEREAWLKLSEEQLLKTWSHPDDDVFNELLAK